MAVCAIAQDELALHVQGQPAADFGTSARRGLDGELAAEGGDTGLHRLEPEAAFQLGFGALLAGKTAPIVLNGEVDGVFQPGQADGHGSGRCMLNCVIQGLLDDAVEGVAAIRAQAGIQAGGDFGVELDRVAGPKMFNQGQQGLGEAVFELQGGQVVANLAYHLGGVFHIADAAGQQGLGLCRVGGGGAAGYVEEEGQAAQKLLDGVVQFLGDFEALALLGGVDLLRHLADLFDGPGAFDEQGGLLGDQLNDLQVTFIEHFFVPAFADSEQGDWATADGELDGDFEPGQ